MVFYLEKKLKVELSYGIRNVQKIKGSEYID